MTDDPLIEWTKVGRDESETVPDVTVFGDGRVRIGPRLAGGETAWRTLSAEALTALRRRVFEDLRLLDIDGDALTREVQAAARVRKQATDTAEAELFTAPQMDADISMIRAADGGRSREIRYYGLFGDSEAYPEVPALQRLRQVEFCVLELASQ